MQARVARSVADSWGSAQQRLQHVCRALWGVKSAQECLQSVPAWPIAAELVLSSHTFSRAHRTQLSRVVLRRMQSPTDSLADSSGALSQVRRVGSARQAAASPDLRDPSCRALAQERAQHRLGPASGSSRSARLHSCLFAPATSFTDQDCNAQACKAAGWSRCWRRQTRLGCC